MEIVLVQLSHEAGEVAVLEVFWQDVFRELFVLREDQYGSFRGIERARTSKTTKLSPSFPHLTTLSSEGFSSILQRWSMGVLDAMKLSSGGHALVQLADLLQRLALRRAGTGRDRAGTSLTKSLELLEPPPPPPAPPWLAVLLESMVSRAQVQSRAVGGRGSTTDAVAVGQREWQHAAATSDAREQWRWMGGRGWVRRARRASCGRRAVAGRGAVYVKSPAARDKFAAFKVGQEAYRDAMECARDGRWVRWMQDSRCEALDVQRDEVGSGESRLELLAGGGRY